MIKQSDTFPNAVCILTFCFAPLVATATGASSDDSRVNVAGYLFDHVYTSINGVVTIPFNSQDWSIDSHTIWSFRNSTGSEKENVWRSVQEASWVERKFGGLGTNGGYLHSDSAVANRRPSRFCVSKDGPDPDR